MAIESMGIIPDGTRRWARREQVSLFTGYRHASANLAKHVEALSQREVRHIHIYIFSIYNLKRDPEEVRACLDAACEFIVELMASQRCIYVSGDIDTISRTHKRIAEVIMGIPACHANNGETAIHLYIGYSFLQHLESVLRNEPSISSIISTLTRRKLDLVIRTGDAITLSDFLPIESRYSQLYFLPTLFNDLSVSELMALCDQYERTFPRLKYGE